MPERRRHAALGAPESTEGPDTVASSAEPLVPARPPLHVPMYSLAHGLAAELTLDSVGDGPEDLPVDGLQEEGERRRVLVPPALQGQRLDRALVALVPEFSRSYLQQLLAEGAVQVNGSIQAQNPAIKPSAKVRTGDTLCIHMRPTAQSRAFVPQAMALAVVFEDAHLLVIDKPAGLVVHPAPGHWQGTLLNALLAHHEAAAALPRAGIVHRLDMDTSGLMVIAKTRQTMDALVALIARREVSRQYLALAHGPWRGTPERSVNAAIGRDPRNRLRMAVLPEGHAGSKPARTDITCLHSTATHCLVHCRLHTGRTHQIRVHMQSLGHPLLCDALYGGAPLPPEVVAEAASPLQRQALHAFRLGFVHPVTGRSVCLYAPPPPDWQCAARALGLERGLPVGPEEG